ncbi:hypothetical protein ACJX0J_009807, partial [Zea mays]
YGPIFRTSVVGEDLIVSLDPELSRRALQEEERAFQIWYPPSFLRVLGADSTVSALGPLHRHIRALVLRLFGPESLRLVLLRDVPRSARAELRSWLRRPGPGVEVRAATSRMIFGVTEKKLISHDVRRGGRREPVEVLRRVHHGPAGVPAPRSRHSLLPMHAGTQEGDGNAEAAARRAQEQERARARATRPRPSASPRSSSSLTDSPEALQELTEEHENIQKRRADPDSDDEVTWEEYKSMKFTSHVIHEALRLANIAPVVFRKTTQDVQMKEYTVPQGSKVMICSAAAHLNPKVYKNPTVFNPWRWKYQNFSHMYLAVHVLYKIVVEVQDTKLECAGLLVFCFMGTTCFLHVWNMCQDGRYTFQIKGIMFFIKCYEHVVHMIDDYM